MGMLTLTFRGPFLFVVPTPTGGVRSQTVDIYAPACEGHLGSVFFGGGSYPIYGRCQQGDSQTYSVSGVNPPKSGIISYQWDFDTFGTSPIVSPDMLGNPPQYASKFPDAYFHINVPRPKVFYALDIVGDTGVMGLDNAVLPFPFHLTAFRLYYDWDLVTPIKLLAPSTVKPANTFYTVTPPVGGPPAGMPNWLPLADAGDIEFQFEGPGMSDPDHQDASACFAEIANLAGLPWWLDYDNGGGGGGVAFRTGSDCHALPIVLGMNN
jgi:hypothetical protein